jgi:hypothetical protein
MIPLGDYVNTREANGRNTDGRTKEEKATTELQDNADNRYDRKGRVGSNENLSCCRGMDFLFPGSMPKRSSWE